jgi:hypothetical protein
MHPRHEAYKKLRSSNSRPGDNKAIPRACGAPEQSESACPSCSSISGMTVTPEPAKLEFRGYAPTIVIYGLELSSGDTVTRVDAPGAASQTRINSEGEISVWVSGVDGVGRSGETRVTKVLCERLRNDGVAAEIRTSQDHRGEDGVIRVGQDFTLQVVTVPDEADFWRCASNASASTSVSLEGATEWLEGSIQKKVRRTAASDRVKMILALDANHFAALAEPGVVGAYVDRFGDPATRFAFGAVWIVGPTAQYCVRVGTGKS